MHCRQAEPAGNAIAIAFQKGACYLRFGAVIDNGSSFFYITTEFTAVYGAERVQIKETCTMGKKEKEKKEKPLDRMTAKELREVALEIPEITGVHSMNKPELLAAIKKARGIEEETTKKSDVSVREIKKKIQELKALRAEASENKDKAKAKILRRRISRLKKKTRRAA